jgi:hypothetical protein
MRTLTILATGHSLTKAQVNYVKRSVTDVMAINESFLMAPWADYLYAGDTKWWEHYGELVQQRFNGELFTISKPASEKAPYPEYVEGSNRENSAGGLCVARGHVYYGGNSGHVALNLAYHFGYDRVILLGFDLHGGHWFKDGFRPAHLNRESPYEHFKCTLGAILTDLDNHGVLVYNCTPNSKLPYIPYTPLEEVL